MERWLEEEMELGGWRRGIPWKVEKRIAAFFGVEPGGFFDRHGEPCGPLAWVERQVRRVGRKLGGGAFTARLANIVWWDVQKLVETDKVLLPAGFLSVRREDTYGAQRASALVEALKRMGYDPAVAERRIRCGA